MLPRRPGLTVVFITYHHSNAVIKAVVSTARSLMVFHTVITSAISKSKFSTPWSNRHQIVVSIFTVRDNKRWYDHHATDNPHP